MEIVSLSISQHAISRYQERVGPLPAGETAARVALYAELMEASPKALKNLNRIKTARTTYIPTEKCIFVASYGSIVTVITRQMQTTRAVAAKLATNVPRETFVTNDCETSAVQP